MDGVTILNTYSRLGNNATCILFLVGCLCGLGIIGGIIIICDGGISNTVAGCFVCAGCFTFFVLLCVYLPRTEYIQATIDDTVSWVELTDKYEIIKSEGRIITMIEKEQTNGSNATE